MTLTELKSMIEAEALRRQAARDGFTLDAVKSWLGQGSAPPPGMSSIIPPPPQPLHYSYFADLDWRDLVTACYVNLLQRNPDPDGMEHSLRSLSRGENKAFIVGRIAYSAEGRRIGVSVAGLKPRYLLAAAMKVPLAGAVLSWLLAFATLHRQQRETRAFQQRISGRLDAIAQYAGQMNAQVALRIDALRSVLEARD